MSGVLRGLRQAGGLQSLARSELRFAPVQRRCMSDEVKVNAWEAPTAIGKWKEEHIVFLVLGALSFPSGDVLLVLSHRAGFQLQSLVRLNFVSRR
mmetsp:Transcript_16214/g.48571  ORF Transcript_16214/g.48571 Transcript_16214/m.48571 type:complete len:95 (-) Transcript_16214:379-663(-)